MVGTLAHDAARVRAHPGGHTSAMVHSFDWAAVTRRHMPLHAVTWSARSIGLPLHAVTCRHTPLHGPLVRLGCRLHPSPETSHLHVVHHAAIVRLLRVPPPCERQICLLMLYQVACAAIGQNGASSNLDCTHNAPFLRAAPQSRPSPLPAAASLLASWSLSIPPRHPRAESPCAESCAGRSRDPACRRVQ